MYVSIIARFALLHLTFYILRGPVNLLIHVFFIWTALLLMLKLKTTKNHHNQTINKNVWVFSTQTRYCQIKKTSICL
jgi:predicted membrane protein